MTALIIGQDLREECIKLKMLVFDLERQNRALCELFQQKLPNQPAAHFQVASSELPQSLSHLLCPGLVYCLFRCRQKAELSVKGACGPLLFCLPCDLCCLLVFQVQTGPLPEFTAQLHSDSAKLMEPAQTEVQNKVLFTSCFCTLLRSF